MVRDIRIAVRAVRSWRLGAAAAVATLAIGIASATILYALLEIALADSSPAIDEISRIGRIYSTNPSLGIERTLPAVRDFEHVLSDTRSFESVAAYANAEMTGRANAEDETWQVMRVSPSLFEVLQIRPAEGRLFAAGELNAGHHVALISEVRWRRDFAGRSVHDSVSIVLDGVTHEVIGILPATVDFPFIGVHGDAWIPLADDDRTRNGAVNVIARLGPEHPWAAAQADLSRLPAPGAGESWRWRVIPIAQDMRHRSFSAASGTVVPAFIVLLIACLNAACMILARGVERNTELSVRAALGATRGALVRQLLVENALLALVAGAAGVGIAVVGLRAIRGWLLPVRPTLAVALTVDLQLVPIALGTSALACLLFGLVPAVRLSRRDISSSLKGDSAPSRARIAGYGARDLVVFVELAFAVGLVVVTGLWFSFFGVLQRAVAGFPAGEVVIQRIALDETAQAAERLRAVPGVQSTSVMSQLPGSERSSMMLRSASGRAARGSLIGVGDAFFQTLGLPLVRGRAFDRTETGSDATAAAVVSESVAATLWPGEDPLGKDLIAGDGVRTRRLAVVGVCRNALEFGGLGVLTAGDVYRPIGDETGEAILVIRAPNARIGLRSIAAALRTSPTAAMPKPSIVADRLVFPREPIAMIRLFGTFALVALLLAGSGIFAVIAQSVAQRTREFGVRMALGASATNVLLMVLTREAKLIAAAIGCGTIATIAATRTLFAELVTISAMHPAWPAALTTACVLVAAAACFLATHRIVRLEPSVILRNDVS